MRRQQRKAGKRKASSVLEVREGKRKGDVYLYCSGRTMEKGKSGVNAFVRVSDYEDGGYRIGITAWGQDAIANLIVPEDCIEITDEGINITIPIAIAEDFDEKEVEDFLAGEELEAEEEEEEEEKPRRSRSKKRSRRR